MKYPCYTTRTGIRIGSAYVPPVREMTYEEIEMQSVLLGKPRPQMSVKTFALICFCVWLALIWVTK